MGPTEMYEMGLRVMERIRRNSRSKCCRDSECGCGLGGAPEDVFRYDRPIDIITISSNLYLFAKYLTMVSMISS